jgi:hypothetical protein
MTAENDEKKISWFNWYCEQLESGIFKPEEPGYYFTCPCCGYPTLGERGTYEICEICNWEDDGQDSHNSEKILSGPNKNYSLSECRENFEKHHTMYRSEDEKFKSKPRIEWAKSIVGELSDFRWKGRVKITETIKKILEGAPKY